MDASSLSAAPVPVNRGPPPRRCAQVGAYVLAVALASSIAWGASAASPVHTVIVVAPVESPPLPLQRLTEALRSQLAELGVRIVFSAGPAETDSAAEESSSLARHRDVLAVVWLERMGETLVVHFYEPAGSSLRERRIPVTHTDAASIEEVAVVVRSAANALLERKEAARGMPSPPAAQSPKPGPPRRQPSMAPAAATPPEREARTLAPLQLALGYAGTLYAAETPWQSGVWASVAWRLGSTPWLAGAAYEWFPPLRRRTEELTVMVNRHPAELFTGYDVLIVGLPAGLRPEIGLTVDPSTRRTEQVSEAFDATPRRTRWAWALSTRLRLAYNPASGWWICSAIGADFSLNSFDYVVSHPEESKVLSPLSARPRLEAGLAVDIP